MKNLRVACSVAALALASTAATTAGAQPVSVDQGDAIVVNGSACTVGFNQGASSYTAAHCGKSGDRVRLLLDDGTLTPEAGTLQDSPASKGTTNDWARIDWDAGVDVGPNEYSGDGVVELDDVHHGDNVCTYGSSTRATTCGAFHAKVGKSFLVDIPGGLDGDSGGPLWVPGLGFLGVHSATVSGRNNTTGVTKTFLLGATTSDGGDITDAVTDAFLDYFDDLEPAASAGAATTSADSGESGATSPAVAVASAPTTRLEYDHADPGQAEDSHFFGLQRPAGVDAPAPVAPTSPGNALESAPVRTTTTEPNADPAAEPAADPTAEPTASAELTSDDLTITKTQPGRQKSLLGTWLCLVLDGALLLFSTVISLIFSS